jgi:hypothetical protein
VAHIREVNQRSAAAARALTDMILSACIEPDRRGRSTAPFDAVFGIPQVDHPPDQRMKTDHNDVDHQRNNRNRWTREGWSQRWFGNRLRWPMSVA